MPRTARAEAGTDTKTAISKNAPPPPASEERTLSGWGRTAPSAARVVTPDDGNGVLASALLAAGPGDGTAA